MKNQPPYALFIRGSQPVIFELSDQLGFEMPMQALAVSVFEDGPDMMFVQALFETQAEAQACAAQLDLIGLEHSISQLPDEDWTSKSQAGLPPVEAGRFFIYGSHDAGNIPMHTPYPIRIDAGLAFGTGHHGTTKGCLLAFETLCAPRSKVKKINHFSSGGPATILDLGCGSGVLAIAAAKSLNRTVTASDIDQDAVDVTIENARINEVADRIHAVKADGVPGTKKFDLIFANILAKPLMVLAPDITRALNDGGHVILAGLLDEQAEDVLQCYQKLGMVLMGRRSVEGWTILTLR